MNAGKLFQFGLFSSSRYMLLAMIMAACLAVSAVTFVGLSGDSIGDVTPPGLAGPKDGLGDG